MSTGMHASAAAARTIDMVIFDLDGTLVDTLADISAALAVALRAHDLPPLPSAAVRAAVGLGGTALARAALTHAGVPVDAERVAHLHERYLAAYAVAPAARSRAFDGIVPLLGRLAARGVALAVCTNKTAGLSRAVLERLGLTRFFAAVVGGDTLAQRKPAPAPLLHAIELGGGRASSALLVGDTAVDASTAQAADVPFAWVRFGYAEQPTDPPPLVVLDAYERFEAALGAAGLILRGAA